MRRYAAILFALVMLASAGLHVYWVLGGTWFLATALNMDVETIPANLVAVTWVMIAWMLACAALGLVRARVLAMPRLLDRPRLWAGLMWACVLVFAAGGLFNAMLPRIWDRWVFAPAFAALTVLAVVLAWPGMAQRKPGAT